MHLNHTEHRELLQAVYKNTDLPDGLPATNHSDVEFLNYLQMGVQSESLNLGMMPVYCGDLALEHDSEEMRSRAVQIPDILKSTKNLAPHISAHLSISSSSPR